MRAGRAWCVAAGLWAATAAFAAELERAASPALQCLQGADSGLVYPPDMLERRDGGKVSIELTFTRRDRGPAVKLLEDGHVLRGLEEAVLKHVGQFRVPCLAEGGAPVVLRQEYAFTPNDGRKLVSTAPRSWTLRNAAIRHAEGLRLPCLGDAPIDARLLFASRLDGDTRLLLKDLPLPRLLAVAQDLSLGVYFDLNTMSCPFDLRWTCYRPCAPNQLGELDSSVPARRAFLDWLSLITLKLPEASRNALIGQTITVTVPCAIIDL